MPDSVPFHDDTNNIVTRDKSLFYPYTIYAESNIELTNDIKQFF